MTAYGDV